MLSVTIKPKIYKEYFRPCGILTIREANVSDIPDILNLYKGVGITEENVWNFQDKGGMFNVLQASDLKEILEKDHLVLVAVLAQKIVGCYISRLAYSPIVQAIKDENAKRADFNFPFDGQFAENLKNGRVFEGRDVIVSLEARKNRVCSILNYETYSTVKKLGFEYMVFEIYTVTKIEATAVNLVNPNEKFMRKKLKSVKLGINKHLSFARGGEIKVVSDFYAMSLSLALHELENP